jgi:hypothetical protein
MDEGDDSMPHRVWMVRLDRPMPLRTAPAKLEVAPDMTREQVAILCECLGTILLAIGRIIGG